jgi:hypothetical protein
VPSATGAVASVHVYVNAPLPDSIPVISQNAHDWNSTRQPSRANLHLKVNSAWCKWGRHVEALLAGEQTHQWHWRLCQGRIAAEKRHTAVLQSGLQHDLARLIGLRWRGSHASLPSPAVSPPPP